MRSILAVLAAGALALTGCASDDPEPTLSGVPLGSESPAPTSTATSPSANPSDFPGEPFGRAIAGGTYDVIGVAHDDVLNVRAGPTVNHDVVHELDPTGTAVATGNDLLHEGGLWFEVEIPGGTGWASYSFLAMLGGTFDITADVVADNGGDVPSAETMQDLGLIVADLRKSIEPASDIVIVVAPTVGDLGEITVDVVGLGDDAQKGERLVVFGTPTGEGFTLDTVEMTLLCGRGVDGDNCV